MTMNITVKHSLIDEKVIKHFLADYGISVFAQCDFLTRGLNDTYVIHAKEHKYIFRVYRHAWRETSAIMFELDAINHLYKKGFRVSRPIQKQDGNYLCEINAPEGIRYGVLFSYTEGERPQINEENSELIGASLGKLHNQTADFSAGYERGYDLDLNHLLAEPVAYISPVINKYLGSEQEEAMLEIVENIKEQLAEKELEIGFCHGDFHNHNMHIKDQAIEVFDFDCCATGYRAYDVAVSWWNLLNNYSKLEEECWDAFLNGYSSQRKLAEDDIESLPLFITVRRIWLLGTMLQNDDVWGTNWVSEKTLELFVLQLKTDRLAER